jgi:hypothetical protein
MPAVFATCPAHPNLIDVINRHDVAEGGKYGLHNLRKKQLRSCLTRNAGCYVSG